MSYERLLNVIQRVNEEYYRDPLLMQEICFEEYMANQIHDEFLYEPDNIRLEKLVMPKIVDITKFIAEWGALDKAPDGEFEQIEDKTLRRLIKAIESNFSV